MTYYLRIRSTNLANEQTKKQKKNKKTIGHSDTQRSRGFPVDARAARNVEAIP